MWVCFLDNQNQMQALSKALGSLGAKFDSYTTSFGGEVFHSKEPSRFPHFAIVADSMSRLKMLFDWVHLNWNPHVILSSGLFLSPLALANQSELVVPNLCLRSAGRVDVGGPVLYEELNLEQNTQKLLVEHLGHNAKVERIFSAERVAPDFETHEWISKNLGCRCVDSYTGELLLLAKRFSVKSACLKVFTASEAEGVPVLNEAWVELLSKLKTL